jgi:MerR family redox-sensitive transcriptional activator SoxR
MMPLTTIGTIAHSVGLAPSAIRYYEKAGLLPKPPRQSGQRRYGTETIGRLRIIEVARAAGFTISETRTFLSGFSGTIPPAARWRELAARKIAELDVLVAQIMTMRQVLQTSFQCDCLRIEDCERAIVQKKGPPRGGPSSQARISRSATKRRAKTGS